MMIMTPPERVPTFAMMLVFALSLSVCSAMMSKNKRPYDAAVMPPATRLRRNIQDILSDNLLTNNRANELIRDVARCRVSGFRGLQSTANKHSREGPRLRRKFMKNSKWPHLYWAKIRTCNVKTGCEQRKWCSFWLPHELLEALAKAGDVEALYERTHMDELTQRHLDQCEAKAACRLVGLGLWCDGCPCNWDRSKSVETISLNLPGVSGDNKSLRIPLVSILRDHVSENTFDDLMAVIAWSLTHCARGTTPVCRHDEREFHSRYGDLPSYRKSGVALQVKAALSEVRGDWKMMSEVFKLPKHNENAGICWSCPCTKAQVFSGRILDGSWRNWILIGSPAVLIPESKVPDPRYQGPTWPYTAPTEEQDVWWWGGRGDPCCRCAKSVQMQTGEERA